MTWNIGAEETVFQERGALRAQAAGISGVTIAKGAKDAADAKTTGISGATENVRKAFRGLVEKVAQTDVLKSAPEAGIRNVVSIVPRAMTALRVLSAEKAARAGRIWKP